MEPVLTSGRFDELRTRSERLLVDFLQTEVGLGSTFVDFARTERKLGNIEHFRHARQDAQTAVDAIRRFLRRVSNPRVRASIERDCDELARSIDRLVD